MSNKCVYIVGPDILENGIERNNCIKVVEKTTQDYVYAINEIEPSTIIIYAHGIYLNNVEAHHILLLPNETLVRTDTFIAQLSSDRPTNIILASCYSGTKPEHLIQNMPTGSVIITTSDAYFMTINYIINHVVNLFSQGSYPLEEVYAKNLPHLTGFPCKYITKDRVFSSETPAEVLKNRETAHEHLSLISKEFNAFIGKNLGNLNYTDKEIDDFAHSYVLRSLISKPEIITQFMHATSETEYLSTILKNQSLNTSQLIYIILYWNYSETLAAMSKLEFRIERSHLILGVTYAIKQTNFEALNTALKFYLAPLSHQEGVNLITTALTNNSTKSAKLLLEGLDAGVKIVYEENISGSITKMMKYIKHYVFSKDHDQLSILNSLNNKALIEEIVVQCAKHDSHQPETANCMEILASYPNIAAVIEEKGLVAESSTVLDA